MQRNPRLATVEISSLFSFLQFVFDAKTDYQQRTFDTFHPGKNCINVKFDHRRKNIVRKNQKRINSLNDSSEKLPKKLSQTVLLSGNKVS